MKENYQLRLFNNFQSQNLNNLKEFNPLQFLMKNT